MSCNIVDKRTVFDPTKKAEEWLIQLPEGVELKRLETLADIFPDSFNADGKIRASHTIYIRLSKPISLEDLIV